MFIQAAYKFLGYLRDIKGASEHTIRSYANDLSAFASFVDGGKPFRIVLGDIPQTTQSCELRFIDRMIIRSYIRSERERNISKRSVARRLSSLRSFFRYCLREKWVEQNPMDLVDSQKLDRTVPHSLSYSQIEHFFSLPDISTLLGYRDRTIMELFYSSGLRVSELAGLNRSDLDQDELLLLVRGKGKKERVIPITENAAQWLQGYLLHPQRSAIQKDGKAIFLNRHGTRLTTRSIDRLFCFYLVKSGFADTITPHVIRHTIATHWLEQGMDLKTIQMLLGHSSMATTTIYTEVSSELKKRVIATLHPRA
jgi:integrase/recombinase XerC